MIWFIFYLINCEDEWFVFQVHEIRILIDELAYNDCVVV